MILIRPNPYVFQCIQDKKLPLPPHDLLYMAALAVSDRTFPQVTAYAILFFRDGHIHLKTVCAVDHVLMAVSAEVFAFNNVRDMIDPDGFGLFF